MSQRHKKKKRGHEKKVANPPLLHGCKSVLMAMSQNPLQQAGFVLEESSETRRHPKTRVARRGSSQTSLQRIVTVT